jgi:hypothetical protein
MSLNEVLETHRFEEDVTAGYLDRSQGGLATAILSSVDSPTRTAIISLAERELGDPRQFPAHIHGLLDELDQFDPNRTMGSSYYAAEELKRIQSWLSVCLAQGVAIQLVSESDPELGPDAICTYWDVFHLDQTGLSPLYMEPPYELIAAHIENVANPKSAFMQSLYAVIGEAGLVANKTYS